MDPSRGTIPAVLTAVLLLLAAGPLRAEPEAPTVRLQESVEVASGPLSLGDITVGDLEGTNYSLRLGSMPEPGSVKYVSRAYIMMMARNHDRPVPEFAGERNRTRIVRPVRTIERQELKRRMAPVVREQLAQSAELNISVKNVPKTLSILPGAYELSVNATNAYQSERGPVWYRFKVQQKGQTIKTFRAKVLVTQHREVPVAVRRLERGTIVQPEMIEWREKKIGRLRGGIVEDPEEILGREVTRNVRAEKILRSSYLMKPIVVERRDQVTIRYRMNGVVITTRGEATEDGAVGDRIRVENSSSEREVSAEVINEELVEVNRSTDTEGNKS